MFRKIETHKYAVADADFKKFVQINRTKRCGQAGFTLAEIVVCFAIMALVIGGTLMAYSNAAKFTQRAGYNLAAQGQSVQVMERVRAALWDTQTSPVLDNTTNWPSFVTTNILELPISGTNVIWATNRLSVITVTNDASLGVQVKMIQVTTTWPWNGTTQTNTIVTYRAPDQ